MTRRNTGGAERWTEQRSRVAARLPHRARAWVVLAMLWFVYVLNFLDRQLLSILAKPIQDTLGVTDGQLGLISGLYFALFYCLISIPVGWLADRTNRVKVLSLACGDLERGNDGLRPRGELSAARRRAHGGRRRRSRRRAALLRDHLRLFPAGPARNGAWHLQSWPAGRTGAGRRVRRGDRGRIQLAPCLHCAWRDRHRRGRRVFSSSCASRVRGGLDPVPQRAVGARPASGRRSGCSSPARRSMLAALGSGATQFITYGLGNFTALFLQREKGMTLEEVAIWYALVVGIAMSAGIFVSGRMIDRFTQQVEAGLRHPAGDIAGAGGPVLHRLRLGAVTGHWRCSS